MLPCQDLSSAGKGAGLDGKRSGLWTEYKRVIGLLRPPLVMIENVPRLLRLHFDRLLNDLLDLGYDCEWDIISAASAGAPHLRERLWILAYPQGGKGPWPRAMGEPKKSTPLTMIIDEETKKRKWPRAGAMRNGSVFELTPLVPRKTKRIDGKTYWVGRMLFGDGEDDRIWSGQLAPTPTGRDYKDTGDLSVVPMNSLLPRFVFHGLLPTPGASDGSGGRVSKEPGGLRPSGAKKAITLATAVAHLEDALLPTPTKADGERGSETYKRGEGNPTLLGAARLLPTPTANDSRGGRNATSGRSDPDSQHHSGETLTDLAFRGDLDGPLLASAAAVPYGSNQGGAAGRVGPVRHSLEQMASLGLWPTPSAAVGRGGPGRSDKRTGGDNLRTAVSLCPSPVASWNENRRTTLGPAVENGQRGQKLAEEVAEDEVLEGRPRGSLAPNFVEWMMGLPKGYTDIDCEEPVFYPFSHEVLPRVAQNIPHRRQRLQAIGNSLVWWVPYWILCRLEANYGLPREEE